MERESKIRRISDSEESGGSSGHPGSVALPASWMLLRRLPYHLRLYVIQSLPLRCSVCVRIGFSLSLPNHSALDVLSYALEFCVYFDDRLPQTGVVAVLGSDSFPCRLYVQSLYGYFFEDFTRKVFLIIKSFVLEYVFRGFRNLPQDPFLVLRLSIFQRRWCPRKQLSEVTLSTFLLSDENPLAQSVDQFFSPYDVEGLIEPPIQTEGFEFEVCKDDDNYYAAVDYAATISSIEKSLNRKYLQAATVRILSFSPLIDFLLLRCPNLRSFSLRNFSSVDYDGRLSEIAPIREGDDLPSEQLRSPARITRVYSDSCSFVQSNFFERFVEVTNLGESLEWLDFGEDCQISFQSLKQSISRPFHCLSTVRLWFSTAMTTDLLGREDCLKEIFPQVRILYIRPVAEEHFDQFLSNLIHLFPNLESLDLTLDTDDLSLCPALTQSRVRELASFRRLKGFGSWIPSCEGFVSVLRCLGELGLLGLSLMLMESLSSEQWHILATHFALIFDSTLRRFVFGCFASDDDCVEKLKELIRIGVSSLSDFGVYVEPEVKEEIKTFVTTLLEEEKPESLARFCLDGELLCYRRWEEE